LGNAGPDSFGISLRANRNQDREPSQPRTHRTVGGVPFLRGTERFSAGGPAQGQFQADVSGHAGRARCHSGHRRAAHRRRPGPGRRPLRGLRPPARRGRAGRGVSAVRASRHQPVTASAPAASAADALHSRRASRQAGALPAHAGIRHSVPQRLERSGNHRSRPERPTRRSDAGRRYPEAEARHPWLLAAQQPTQGQLRPFTRCLECNGTIRRLPPDQLPESLDPDIAARFEQFWQCGSCHRVYWQGSHYRHMLRAVQRTAVATGRSDEPEAS